MYSFSYLEPVCCSMCSSNCCFLTCIQISQEADQVVWYSHLFQNFPEFIVIHTVKGFGIVNEAETDVFLKISCFFNYPADVGNLFSGSSAFSKTSLNIWWFMVHVLLKPGLENFELYFTSVWSEVKWSEVAEFCLTFCNPMDCSPPGSSIHGIFQVRVLKWVAISFSRGIFPTQGSSPGLLHCRWTLCRLSHQGSPLVYEMSATVR